MKTIGLLFSLLLLSLVPRAEAQTLQGIYYSICPDYEVTLAIGSDDYSGYVYMLDLVTEKVQEGALDIIPHENGFKAISRGVFTFDLDEVEPNLYKSTGLDNAYFENLGPDLDEATKKLWMLRVHRAATMALAQRLAKLEHREE